MEYNPHFCPTMSSRISAPQLIDYTVRPEGGLKETVKQESKSCHGDSAKGGKMWEGKFMGRVKFAPRLSEAASKLIGKPYKGVSF